MRSSAFGVSGLRSDPYREVFVATSTPAIVHALTREQQRVLVDLARFGVLTLDQIVRRLYPTRPAWKPTRLPRRLRFLLDHDYVSSGPNVIQDTRLYAATPLGVAVTRAGPRRPWPSLQHLRHDVAVVDLADALLAQCPNARWIAESEVGRLLRTPGTARRLMTGPTVVGANHRPDGVLVVDGQRIAIELEHSDKGDQRYATIFRWFALNDRVDAVRWYVDDQRIIDRLRRVGSEYGFAEDVEFSYSAFPPGVAMRGWVKS